MAKLRQVHRAEVKHKLSNTLRNWLPILHSNLADLEEVIAPFVETNPLIEVTSGFEESVKEKYFSPHSSSASQSGNLVDYSDDVPLIQKESLYDFLFMQIDNSLFPTPISKKIALFIIENLDADGYYDGDTQSYCLDNSLEYDKFEKIRKRFAFIEPVGVASKNLSESFLFQLENLEVDEDIYSLAIKIIEDINNIYAYSKEKYFNNVVKIISKFSNPPAIDYQEESQNIVVDLLINFNENKEIEVKLNDEYYPIIKVNNNYEVEHEYLKDKFKEAKSLVDALEMRRSTIYKVGLMIVEYQYEFFAGGKIMPLKLQTLADEFGHNSSTISRAIANKYISCDRGIFAMKDFFSTALDDDLSNDTIKNFVIKLIENENRLKPLSDMKLLALINEEFNVSIVRRTIAKYRKQLNIAGSSDRKKVYRLGL